MTCNYFLKLYQKIIPKYKKCLQILFTFGLEIIHQKISKSTMTVDNETVKNNAGEFNYEVYPVRTFESNSPNDYIETENLKKCGNEIMMHSIIFCCGFLFFPVFFASLMFYGFSGLKITKYPISCALTIINTILGLLCTAAFIYILINMNIQP